MEFRILQTGERLLWLGLACVMAGPALLRAQQEPPPEEKAKAAALLAERRQLEGTVWKNEVLAREHEQSLVNLWDALLDVDRSGRGDKFAILANLAFSRITLGKRTRFSSLAHGIESIGLGTSPPLTNAQWVQWLAERKAEGYRLVQSEWHHAKFTPGTELGNAVSEVSVALHVTQESSQTRIAIEGPIAVVWSKGRDAAGHPVPLEIDATKLHLLKYTGPPAFEKWHVLAPSKPGQAAGIHPLLLHDLDHDGRTEIIAAGCNRILSLGEEGEFQSEPLLTDWERFHETGLLADFTGDGHVDFVAPSVRGDMMLYPGGKQGLRHSKGKGRTKRGGPLRQPTALTAGDIDLDGDLDLWVGQYRISYLYGTMPSPYHDANDGFPAYLLLNEGKGNFKPRTPEAGLEKKRHRRTFTSSFIDLDDDHDLDLMVVSDFAGVDLYENNGQGLFTDITSEALDERHLFGMSATFADFNLDGLLDIYVAGMASTTARRLEHMKAKRTDDPEVDRLRMVMAYGNRMYVNRGGGKFRQPVFKDEVARTGWTWGTTSLDFDNDGDADIFVANGHSSGKSTKDHCSLFWCHDIYHPLTKPDKAMEEVFRLEHKGYFDKTESWDGYQKSHLLMNEKGSSFTNIAFLMGVADQFDGRAALSEDIDGDGRVDLLIVEDHWTQGQTLHIYRNTMENDHAWIGVRLRHEPGKPSPIGAKVTVLTKDRTFTSAIATGESIHGQHSLTRHFGLGNNKAVKAIEVIWPGGKKLRIEAPEVGRYHRIRHP